MGATFTVIFIIAIIFVYKTFIIVPEQYAYIKERWGKYQDPPLKPGFHFLIPIMDRIHYEHSLKEVAYDVPPQECITKDNVSVEVDGILYIKILDPAKTSYGIDNYLLATTQLAKTTLRSEIGKLNLDDTFSERESINQNVVRQVDHATDAWGIKVTRYEIKNITPPKQVLHSMEQQMRAEREKRAEITISEGEKAARINRSLGERKEAINISEGEKQKRINEAEGRAIEIEMIATATATGIKAVAEAIAKKGGDDAVDLQITQGYLESFGKILVSSKTTVLPSNMANIVGAFEGLSKVTGSFPGGKTIEVKGDKK
ncbi:MAG: paraslipin [Leptospiraceae bacterium]|jgi:regulator of protease activity HflC (stomatin/prohibitin superfamily)|nr:paraslipin [Leptospiraceae bacterium]MBK9501527.1 paraslipin [Leptospiraceae bacterium]MBP9161923.1 paraslipin [Leptospiraceae bacterium]HRG46251.1 stomatin-like protein [Leptospiraceae bacterium]HRG75082.1 stomatin-like protein [Leptospiraceae bacterium]